MFDENENTGNGSGESFVHEEAKSGGTALDPGMHPVDHERKMEEDDGRPQPQDNAAKINGGSEHMTYSDDNYHDENQGNNTNPYGTDSESSPYEAGSESGSYGAGRQSGSYGTDRYGDNGTADAYGTQSGYSSGTDDSAAGGYGNAGYGGESGGSAPVHRYSDGTYRSGSYAGRNTYSHSYGNESDSRYSSTESGAGVSGKGTQDSGQHYSYQHSGTYGADATTDLDVRNPAHGQEHGSTQKNAAHPHKTYKRKKGLNAYAKSVCCGIIVGVIAAAIILGSMAVGRNVFGTSSSTASVSTTSEALNTTDSTDSSDADSSSGTTGQYTVSEIADKCISSVVAITCTSVEETQGMFGQIYSEESVSAGSGVIISQSDDELLIVTNYHVIEGSDELTVCFNDSEDAVYSASQKGTDSENDLAVIAVSLDDMSEEVLDSIVIATVGDSTQLSVGDQVVAIGNALGYGQSVTAGYVSALEREVTIDENTTTTLLQTDAAINPGNSGGALFNMNGELIGINSAKYSDTDVEGMGFAIPMSTAQSIIEDLMNQTTRDKLESGYGYLGIYGSDVDSTTSETYGIPEGVYISDVVEGGAAETAGLQSGDVITGFDGTTISSMSTLQEKLQYYAAGETVEVTIQRSSDGTYAEQTVEVTLGNADDAETTTSSDTEDSTQQDGTDSYGQDGSDSYGYGDGGTDSFGSFFGN